MKGSFLRIVFWLVGSLGLNLGFLRLVDSTATASEVIEETETKVVVRQHPSTGRPYVSIVSPGKEAIDLFRGERKQFSRPDYRLLDPKAKPGEIPYDGPYSDRRKIYIFAASLATLGTASGALTLAAAPAATGAAASGGAGAYLAGAGTVVTGTTLTVARASHNDPKKENYTQRSESRLLKKEGENS